MSELDASNDDTRPSDGETSHTGVGVPRPMGRQADDPRPVLSLEQLLGKYFRLRDELNLAWVAVNPRTSRQGVPHLDRLTEDIAQVEREIRRLAPVDEQTDELHTGFRF